METLIPLLAALVLLIATDLEDLAARARRRTADHTGRA
jgi:hypothetical protein